jgi:3-methyladenine DNA glycosylase Mpg
VIDGDKNTGVELFDLKKDSAESNNLAKGQAALAKKLQLQLRDWQTSVLNSLMEADYK